MNFASVSLLGNTRVFIVIVVLACLYAANCSFDVLGAAWDFGSSLSGSSSTSSRPSVQDTLHSIDGANELKTYGIFN